MHVFPVITSVGLQILRKWKGWLEKGMYIYIHRVCGSMCSITKSIIKNQWSFKLVFYTLENQKTTEDFLNVFIEV